MRGSSACRVDPHRLVVHSTHFDPSPLGFHSPSHRLGWLCTTDPCEFQLADTGSLYYWADKPDESRLLDSTGCCTEVGDTIGSGIHGEETVAQPDHPHHGAHGGVRHAHL